MLWTSTEVVVAGADITGLVVAFQPGMTISGRLVFAGTRPAADLAKLRVRLTPVDIVDHSFVTSGSVAPNTDGTFAIGSLAPGQYGVTVDGADGWSIQSAVARGRDTLDDALDLLPNESIDGMVVTLTDRVTEISGKLVDALGRPAPGYSVFVFPTTRAWWTSAPRRTSGAIKVGTDGAFKVVGLPPGEYYLSALADVDPSQLRDPSVLEQIAGAAITITLAEGQNKQQDLRIGG